ncbi:putative amino acid transporter, transmembrane domain-containing protein [Helianthus annuus]|uniref:Amino acid transporter, transmembrane domain-containing protein n=1 Tax=Helianthus annuus TaxID=4232 RepID=A0A251TXQ9_HELAN|nr:amino acid transporter AVT1I [Helianthus annuus]KAF5791135.1 putative amino acid transporter, transmembrane domain-containing protein [Helianthus annuus]KAJ0893407.1 putative amino acid transporter, transmembrane domain-containing protein [Helianthus annuus]
MDPETQHLTTSSATSSFLNTCFNGLNALSGVGIITVPYALAAGGWLSLLLLFTIAISTFYTGLLIKRCMDTDPTIRSYPDIGDRAFGKTGRIIVLILINMELYLVATGFLIMEGDNLSNMFPQMDFDILGVHVSSKKSFVIIVAAIILPTTWLNNMRLLSYISASGVLASLIVLGSVLWVGVFDGVGLQEKGRLVSWNGMPSAISLYAFCYGVHPVLPTLYTSMRNKHQFSKVLLLCFVFSTVTYSSMAVIGYLMFGSKVESQITLSLPTDKTSSRVAIFTTLVTPILKYALLVTPIVDSIKERLLYSFNTKKYSLLIKTSLVITTVVVAIALPFFGDLMSLVGALLIVAASSILPSLCYLKISGTYKIFGLELVLIGFIVLIGILVAIMGTYTALADILRKL